MSKFPITSYSEYKGLERLDKGSYTDHPDDGTPSKQVDITNYQQVADTINEFCFVNIYEAFELLKLSKEIDLKTASRYEITTTLTGKTITWYDAVNSIVAIFNATPTTGEFVSISLDEFLLQENLDLILQEDGFKLIL